MKLWAVVLMLAVMVVGPVWATTELPTGRAEFVWPGFNWSDGGEIPAEVLADASYSVWLQRSGYPDSTLVAPDIQHLGAGVEHTQDVDVPRYGIWVVSVEFVAPGYWAVCRDTVTVAGHVEPAGCLARLREIVE